MRCAQNSTNLSFRKDLQEAARSQSLSRNTVAICEVTARLENGNGVARIMIDVRALTIDSNNDL
jgi:hypothetical protein